MVTLGRWTVKNTGDSPSGAFRYGIYLSNDPAIATTDTRLGGGQLSSLDPGAQYDAAAINVFMPAATALGAYYVGVLVDEGNTVVESSETNNSRSVPLTVALAELHLTTTVTVSPTPVSRGGVVTLSPWTVRNDGPATSPKAWNGIYLSTDPIITTADVKLGAIPMDTITPGGSFQAAAVRVVIPGPLPIIEQGTPLNPGTYYVGVLTDEGSVVAESNEGNNYAATAIRILGGPSDRHPVWRVQIRLVTGDVGGGGTDDDVNIRLTTIQDSTWIDYARNDFERGDNFLYDLGFSNGVTTLDNIQMLRVTKFGGDAWCLKKIEIVVNGNTTLFSRTFGPTCQWLNAQPTVVAGNPVRLRQNSVSLTIGYGDLRQDPTWLNADPPILPPFFVGQVSRQELESRIEATVGDALFDAPGQTWGAWSARVEWGALHGRAVEASRPSLSGNRVHIDLDLNLNISGAPDAELDVDFDIVLSCTCGTFRTEVTNLEADVDSRWYNWILSVLRNMLQVDLEGGIANGMRSAIGSMSGYQNIGFTYCPTIAVDQNANINFTLPPDGPDLVVTTPLVITPTGVPPGSNTVTLSSWTVVNKGTKPSGAFTSGVYLSNDWQITAGDILLTRIVNPSLAACDSTKWPQRTVTVPAATPVGQYSFGVLVDDQGQVNEVEERNNARNTSLNIGYPDLALQESLIAGFIVHGGDMGYTHRGGTVSIQGPRVVNQGVTDAGAFSVGFYLSTDTTITADDIRLGTIRIESLPVTSNSASGFTIPPQTFTIPTSVNTGWYYIGVLVDSENDVRESDERNNFLSKYPLSVSY